MQKPWLSFAMLAACLLVIPPVNATVVPEPSPLGLLQIGAAAACAYSLMILRKRALTMSPKA